MTEPKRFDMLTPEQIEHLKNDPLPPETAEMAADKQRADSMGLSPVARSIARKHRMRSGRG